MGVGRNRKASQYHMDQVFTYVSTNPSDANQLDMLNTIRLQDERYHLTT
jgi:hypothetical protein